VKQTSLQATQHAAHGRQLASIAYNERLKRPKSNNGMKVRTPCFSWYIKRI